jgi:hypothetical protein
VRTYADLAALSAREIAAQLKLDHKIVAADVIDEWIAQAGQLARQAGEQGKWKVFATFVVVFEEDGTGKYRTMVHHMESDQTEQWADSEAHKVGDWINTKIDAKRQQTPESTSPALPPVRAIPLESVMPEESPAPEPVTSHERLQQLLAKAATLTTHQEPVSIRAKPALSAPQRPTPPLAGQPQYSGKLQKFLSKAQAIKVADPAQKP